MLTLYYVSATFLQSWRISKICQKISDQLAQQATISFYVLPQDKEHGFYSCLATSELCSNRQIAKVSDILWLQGNNRGCSLMPLQSLPTSAWITFPDAAPGLQPFHYFKAPEALERSLNSHKNGLIRLLLETDTRPCYDIDAQKRDIVRIENYGKLIAWKIDSNLAILIETDIEHFTKLLIDTFLQNHFLINDQLPLLRIESVKNYGLPQPYNMLATHLKKPARSAERCKPEEWSKHLDDLRALGVLAKQAIEYASHKTKQTDAGKSGNIKPDLIPLEKQRSIEKEKKQTKESPKKLRPEIKKGESLEKKNEAESLEKIKKDTTDFPKTTSPVKKFIKYEQESVEKQINTSTKLDEPLVSTIQTASTFAVTTAPSSPSKLKAKPTEIKKPGILRDSGRFKTSKISEASAETEAKKAGELEKIAAAKVAERSKSKSPTSKIKTSNEITSSPDKSETALIKTKAENTETQKSDKETPAIPAVITTSEILKTTNIISTSVASNVKNITSNDPVPEPSTSKKLIQSSNTFPVKDNAKRPSLKRHKDSIKESKPLNVLVYAETASARESAINTLKDILADNTYTIYPMTQQQAQEKHWKDTAALLVVCGSVATTMGELFVDYFLHGGKVLSLCSDVLHFILPTYRTAEVREHELVQFSYDKWQRVKMMHHIFCYQPSPVKKNFSTDSDDSAHATNRKPAPVCPPRSIELKDLKGHLHQLDVQVLGTEETWNTPSLLLAHNQKNGGSAVFSQVHLELSPTEFESDENKYAILKQNDAIRHEIFSDLLKKHLSLNVKAEKKVGALAEICEASSPIGMNGSGPKCVFKNAYFLGRHESKFDLLQKLKEKTGIDNSISTQNLVMKFCGPDDKLPNVNSNILPILVHSCPEDFSTVEYFDDLKTQYVGRLVIYTPIINSSQNVITDLELTNGIAVIARQQTSGVGRSNNQWLSPLGCAMFSLQLHISLNSPLGKRLPLLQHIIGAAIVQALKGHDIYKVLNFALKWPNDIYANGNIKIGGLVVKTTVFGTNAIANIGCGINLDNTQPTICINDMIRDYNSLNQKKLPLLKYEQFIAMIFNEIENLVEMVQRGKFENFYKLYYELWMHGDQSISIADKDGSKKDAKVIGIDDYGYLQVKLANGSIQNVMPDGNSFDMLQGLIIPKYN